MQIFGKDRKNLKFSVRKENAISLTSWQNVGINSKFLKACIEGTPGLERASVKKVKMATSLQFFWKGTQNVQIFSKDRKTVTFSARKENAISSTSWQNIGIHFKFLKTCIGATPGLGGIF